MKKLISLAAIAAAIALLFTGCGNDENDGGEPDKTAAPVISLVGGDIDAKHEITSPMSVKVNVKAEGGIQEFGIGIKSPALTQEVLGGFNLAAEMNLVEPASDAMGKTLAGLGFPVGADVKGKTELSFDISELIPLIALLYDKTSNHDFVLTITDAKSQTTVKTLKFHLTGATAVTYNNDADLWANTATLAVELGTLSADQTVVEYKKSTETEWQTAAFAQNADASYTASIAPEWKAEADHASGAKQYSLDGKTGVFAGYTYDFRLVNSGAAVEGTASTFATVAGQKIPGGDMESWEKFTVKNGSSEDVELDRATADDGSVFWGSGNNFMSPTLCQPHVLPDNKHAAKLQGTLVFGAIFAAGNFFSGVFDFNLEEYNGYARFGQKYEFTARPRALKLRYQATIGTITQVGLRTDVAVGDVDRGRIFVCITDWTEPHSVMSGMGAMGKPEDINPFDPEQDASTAEGKILAYGAKWLDASATEWTELIIPIIYKDADRSTKPATEKYSLVISTAASAYGDYLCGCVANSMLLDDIEWVY